MRSLLVLPLAALAVLFAGLQKAEAAAIITFTGAPDGMVFTIESVAVAADLFAEAPTQVNDTFEVTLKLVTDGSYTDPYPYLQSIALNFGAPIDDFALAPWGGGFLWVKGDPNEGVQVSNGNCVANDVDGAACAEENPGEPNIKLVDPGEYTWVFKVDFGSSAPIGTSLSFSVSGINPANQQWQGNFVGPALTGSGPVINPNQLPPGAVVTPEPGSMILLGTGIAALAAVRLRRRKA